VTDSWIAILVALAMRTGIPPAAWLAEDPYILETALELLEESHGTE